MPYIIFGSYVALILSDVVSISGYLLNGEHLLNIFFPDVYFKLCSCLLAISYLSMPNCQSMHMFSAGSFFRCICSVGSSLPHCHNRFHTKA
jgi:hypothetical protein